ncbi:MAG: hypothetical protein DMF63_12080 [Acidobacteria bacterium]|nr:MAG: hypothetical protein DMF63_12080 [Acidobacteriota bacterium]
MNESASGEQYDLETIETTCLELGLPCKRTSDCEIEVAIAPGSVLVIANTDTGTDTYLGFRDVPAHSHGPLILMIGEATYVEYDPSEVLRGLVSGHVVILTQYMRGQLTDRWLAHRDEKIDIRYIEADEEIRIYRVGDRKVFEDME